MDLPILPTSLVGSYPQPGWLIDREALRDRLPPRIPAPELWRVDPPELKEAFEDATVVAIRDQELAGLDIITDGEIRRESYSNRFATSLAGVDVANPGSTPDRLGNPMPVPRVVGALRRTAPVHLDDLLFLRANTGRPVKVTLPGPFTMSQQAQNEFYEREQELAFAYADAVREEMLDLFGAGADVVQLDEPWMEARPEPARRYGLETLERTLDGVSGTTSLHICFGYPAFIEGRPPGYSFLTELAQSPVDQISIETAQSNLDLAVLQELSGKAVIVGVLALDTPEVESEHAVAERIRRALAHKPAEELIAAPDCGMKYLPRGLAYRKLEAMVAGVRLL
jgi:5-methyltetrahydropteroyltriglutamate--homocysteine methyltransferase